MTVTVGHSLRGSSVTAVGLSGCLGGLLRYGAAGHNAVANGREDQRASAGLPISPKNSVV